MSNHFTGDKLTLESIPAQFCSDWLKEQISELFAGKALAERKLERALRAISNDGYHQADLRRKDCMYCEVLAELAEMDLRSPIQIDHKDG